MKKVLRKVKWSRLRPSVLLAAAETIAVSVAKAVVVAARCKRNSGDTTAAEELLIVRAEQFFSETDPDRKKEAENKLRDALDRVQVEKGVLKGTCKNVMDEVA